MANQGVYREPGPVGGLPLPRTRLMPLTIAVILLAVLAVLVPELLLAAVGHSASGAWRIFRDGGMSMWLLLLLDLVVPVGIAILGSFVLRGRRAPSSPLFVLASLPYVVALLGGWSGQNMMMGALSGGMIDPEQKARILAEGIGESMANDIFGGFVACGAAIVAAAAAASALATIDVALVTRAGPKPSSLGVVGAAAAGGAWILATIVIGALRLRHAGGLVLLPVLPVLVLVVFAVLAGRGTSILRAWHDRAEASRGVSALAVAGCAALLAVLALQRGIESSFTARAFEAISGESVDPSQRAAILGGALDASRLASAAFAIHAVLGGLTFLLALAPGRAAPSVNAIVALGLGALLVGASLELAHLRTAAPRKVLANAPTPGGVTLPVIVETFSDKASGGAYGERVVIAKDGTGEGDASSTPCSSEHRATLYADAEATLGMVKSRLPDLSRCASRATFVVTRNHPADIDQRLGDYALFLGTTAYFNAAIGLSLVPQGRDTVTIRSVADDAIEINGSRMALPITSVWTSDGPQITQIVYSFRQADTVAHAIRTMSSVETLFGKRLAWSFTRYLEISDRTTLADMPPMDLSNVASSSGMGIRGPSLRQGATQVNGRLPPEVVQRIVRQNFGRFRLCYENGLRSNPTLQGRITVKFVIDRSGSVSTASDGGSDLPDPGVVSCVTRGFGNLSFPQPEGGIVTVVYPIIFSPAP